MSEAKGQNGPLVAVVVFVMITAVIFAVYNYKDQKSYFAHQEKIAAQSAIGAAENVAIMIENLRKSLTFFTKGFEPLLIKLSENPDDTDTHAIIDTLLSKHYDEYYAFTLADGDGKVIYDDFGERIGEVCRRDIQAFSKSAYQSEIYIHPGPGKYHFDIMLPWHVDGKKKVFFASFKASAIARLLNNTQIADHELMLLRQDIPDLIEITAEGSRAIRGESIRLTPEAQARILHRTPIANSRWIMVDIASRNLFSRYRNLMWTQYAAVMGVFLLTGVFLLGRIYREERHRYQAEAALRKSYEELEDRVSERTTDLSQANQNLRGEINERRKLSRVVEQTDNTVAIIDRNGIIKYVNPAFEKKISITFADAVGQRAENIQPQLDNSLFEKVLKNGEFHDVLVIRRRDGSLYHEVKTVSPLRDEDQNVTHFVATGKDITERVEAEQRIEFLAFHDPLTGLPNRAQLIARLAKALVEAEPSNTIVAILFIDLDRFKTINDSLGHTSGDALLKVVAKKLAQATDDRDTIARLGDDDFALILESRTEIGEIITTAKNILNTLAKPVDIYGNLLTSTASIGISIYPFDDEIEALLKHADTALHRAKEAGGNCYEFYTNDMGDLVNRRLHMESRLHGALERQEFVLHYQPRVNLVTGEISGAEALLRWRNPEIGLVPPLHFIPLLEETGLIMEVGEWVIGQACRDFRHLPKHLRLAVNLSVRQFQQPNLAHRILTLVPQSGYDLNRLDIEVTESILAKEESFATEILNTLHHAGVQIAVDDFGTGYSSLSYLKRFPINCLKVDRTFIADLTGDSDSFNLVAAIVSMAHSLGLSVVAEGIETEAQKALVHKLDCKEGQGYLFSPPLPLAQFKQLVEHSGDTKVAPFAATH